MVRMRAFARHVFAVLVAGAAAHAFALTAPNVVAISDRLVTAGQPSREALAALSAEAFQAVIYLAPSTVFDAVKDEPEIVARQGIEFVHIPIPFGAPTAAHADALAAALDRLKGKKVLVHCQVNMRASTLVFLYAPSTCAKTRRTLGRASRASGCRRGPGRSWCASSWRPGASPSTRSSSPVHPP